MHDKPIKKLHRGSAMGRIVKAVRKSAMKEDRSTSRESLSITLSLLRRERRKAVSGMYQKVDKLVSL